MSVRWKGAFAPALRRGLVGAVIGLAGWLLFETIRMPVGEESLPSQLWYGNWRAVALISGIFVAFVLGFIRPRRRAEWGRAGLYSAFLISLFTEMFGVPLTIYLLAPALGLPSDVFGLHESHLWAFLLAKAGVVSLGQGVYLVMVISVALIAAGATLLGVGWYQVHGGRGTLVMTGIYRYLRHPQYLGLILIVVAFNIQWPTIPTLLMGPVLIGAYVWQARREDADLEARFGADFGWYERRVNALFPWPRPLLARYGDWVPPSKWSEAWPEDPPPVPPTREGATKRQGVEA